MRLSLIKTLTTAGFCALVGAAACAAQQPGPRSPYDGRWWLPASELRRDGFLTGYFDCYNFEYKGPDHFLTKSYHRYRDLVTRFYQDSATHRDRSLADVVYQFRDKPGEKDEYPGGEPAHGRHWGNDGVYWRQASNEGHDQQLGFVEGYLYCHEKLAKNKGGMFPKTPEEYRALITQWYRFDEKTDAVDAKRDPEAIADVLFQVRTGIK